MKTYNTDHNGTDLTYQYEGNRVSIVRNGEYWGSPQGERYVVALLKDIEKLQEENDSLETELMMLR